MSMWIDADEFVIDLQKRYCKPCKKRKEDYNGIACKMCWVDDTVDEIERFSEEFWKRRTDDEDN